MQTYIVLLRGINVGGHKKIKMKDLKQLLEGLGFCNVETYIQSGNIVLKSEEASQTSIENIIQKALFETYSFEVPVLVLTPQAIQHILDACPFAAGELEKSYFTLLHKSPSSENKQQLLTYKFPNETFTLIDTCVYSYPELGAGKAKANNNFFENKLGVTATTRNHRTLKKLQEMAS